MSKLTAAAATSHTLSVTATEEASRLGDRTVGIDHLFLAIQLMQLSASISRAFR